jgi:hypothetical protein
MTTPDDRPERVRSRDPSHGVRMLSSDNVFCLGDDTRQASYEASRTLDIALANLLRAWVVAVPHMSLKERHEFVLQVRTNLGLIVLVET